MNILDEAEASKVLDAARHHIFTHGIRSLTMDKLAADTGISKRLIYAHFHGKQLLLESAINTKLSEMDRDLTDAEDSASNFVDRMQAVVVVLREHSKEYSSAYIHDLLESNPLFFEWVRTKRAKVLDEHFGRLFASGRSEGAIRGDISDELFIEIYKMLTDGILMGNIMKKKAGTTVPEIYGQIVAVMLEGTLLR